MGYESRIYIVEYHATTNFAECICAVNLSKMGYDSTFYDLFTAKIPKDLDFFRCDGGDVPVHKDNYDEDLKWADLNAVHTWAKAEMEKSDYRRIPILYHSLDGFMQNRFSWGDLKVIFYGY